MRTLVVILLCFCSFVVVAEQPKLVSDGLQESVFNRSVRERSEGSSVSVGLGSNVTSSTEIANKTTIPETHVNATLPQMNITKLPEDPVRSIDLSKPGVLKRALLVFGGFGLLAVAYFLFYRLRQNKNINQNKNPSDGLQFRYGVLQSDDHSDRMELSHVPLTIDSDEDDDEDDVEIFDLGEKKKSYVNLNSEEQKEAVDEIMTSATGRSWNNDELLLDIDDGNAPAVLSVNNDKCDMA